MTEPTLAQGENRRGVDVRVYDIILKKRRGCELSEEEINLLISRYTQGDIPDYQMSAFLMAVFFQGMSVKETHALTMAMAHQERQWTFLLFTELKSISIAQAG